MAIDRITLKKGKSQRKDGRYSYRWTADDGTRHTVYALTLEELREKEHQVAKKLKEDPTSKAEVDYDYVTALEYGLPPRAASASASTDSLCSSPTPLPSGMFFSSLL